MRLNIRAFTIMEIMIVVVIVGLLTAFAIPNYGKAIQKADERTARSNLYTMRTAAEFLISSDTATTTIPVSSDLNAINTNLSLSITDPKMTYSCTAGNICQAIHANGWTLHFHLSGGHNTDGTVHCSAGTCPSCPNNPGDCG